MRSYGYITTLLIGTLSLASLPAQAAYHSLEEIRQTAAQYAAKRLNAGANSMVEAGELDPRLKLQQCPTPLNTKPLGSCSANILDCIRWRFRMPSATGIRPSWRPLRIMFSSC